MILGRDKHASNAYQLKSIARDCSNLEESVEYVDGKEESLRDQLESAVNFNKPKVSERPTVQHTNLQVHHASSR